MLQCHLKVPKKGGVEGEQNITQPFFLVQRIKKN